MSTRHDRLRWRLARVLVRAPFMCWADLVSWAQRSHGYTLRGCMSSRRCRSEADACAHGCCYCGKFQRDTTGGTS